MPFSGCRWYFDYPIILLYCPIFVIRRVEHVYPHLVRLVFCREYRRFASMGTVPTILHYTAEGGPWTNEVCRFSIVRVDGFEIRV